MKVVELSDDVIITVQDETANEVADMLTQNAYSTFDKIARNAIVASASQINCSRGLNGSTPTEFTVGDIEEGIDYLEANNARKLAPSMPGSDAVGTGPVWQAYWGIVHTDLRSDLKGLRTFLSKNQYPTPSAALQSELGETDEVRWVKSTEASKSSDATPIYTCPIIGANAYGVVNIDETALEMIFKPLGAGQDPLNQRQSMGWKGRFGAGLLDDGWVVNLRATKAA